MALPLSGISVLDFSTLLPGPMASAILAAAGAQVIKVERPEGDDARRIPPFVDGRPVLYDALNRAKDVITLDLRAPEGRAEALALAARADVVITQVRPGVMERLGLGYEDIRTVRPDVIYCAITGYGQHGPRAAQAGHDLNYLAEAGVFGAMAGPPRVPGGLFADVGGGTLPAVINILLALRQREASGQGAFLDIAMARNARAFVPQVSAERAAGGIHDAARSPFGGGSARYRFYAAADGGMVAVGAIEEKFWARFCALIELAPDAASAQAVEARIGARPLAHWAALFAQEDCCVSVLEDAPCGAGTMPALHLPLVPAFGGPAPVLSHHVEEGSKIC